uniref:Selenocysteine lyase n=1 Tax=Ficedula albicollis TaxID=59894 RepID=A0A803W3X9_FICAL
MGMGTEPVEAQCDSLDGRVYLDYNATTPLAPEVAQAVWDAMCQAWGNPSSSHPAGRKAKELISSARESLARMLGGRPEDIIFTSGGTEANNMVIHTACRHFHESQHRRGDSQGTPHIVTSSVEHDSIRLPLEQLGREGLAEATFVPVSPRSGQAEVDDVLAAIQPNTCLVSLMLANNETGVIMPVAELSQRVRVLNQRRAAESQPRILVHTDAAQMIGKGRVDVQELGVDYLTIVGHKFHGPRIGALYTRSPGTATPLHPMLFGGGQERSFRPGTENTPMIAGLGQVSWDGQGEWCRPSTETAICGPWSSEGTNSGCGREGELGKFQCQLKETFWGTCCRFAALTITQLTWHTALRGDTDLALAVPGWAHSPGTMHRWRCPRVTGGACLCVFSGCRVSEQELGGL